MQVHHVLGDDVSFLRSNSFSTLASGDGADLNDMSDGEEEEVPDEDGSEKKEEEPEESQKKLAETDSEKTETADSE
jgi:hypothetical protein